MSQPVRFRRRSHWDAFLAGYARAYGALPGDFGVEGMAATWRGIGNDLYGAMLDVAADSDSLHRQLAANAGKRHDELMALAAQVKDNPEVRQQLIASALQHMQFQSDLLAAGGQEST